MIPGLRSDARTHAGTVRSRNEDAVVHRPDLGLWAVADGAGGHGGGDVAAAAVASALEGIPPGLSAAEMLAQLRLRLSATHEALRRRAAEQGPGRVMASTIVVLLLRSRHFACLWAGDSRAYRLREGALQMLTRDHSLVQEMVDRGELAAEAAERHPQANIILRAVGGGEGPLLLDKVSDSLQPGDVFLLCSDGLFKALPEEAIARLLRQGADAAALVQGAVAAGARDNVSAVVLRHDGAEDTLPGLPRAPAR
ncbi:PP2C family serine/threonine-protein phosphatase [Pseudoroseomonas cervicalis]|uniref:PP2C family protein-serine/threonine phosphatase n=1 Tax=Teichococcus cervicalis TaxID=204525 RepID=UPI0022F17843|nr:protein phosphatase 2C domain-containing protein [Pseudoroseomonas cervicalis]WBV44901.1 protein phosphatase 2C domain-containing protein [Pseudoroseomonas cervicalis]